MNVVCLLLGLVIGAGCAVLVLRARLTAMRAELDGERALSEQRAQNASAAQEQLRNEFKSLSAEALDQNMTRLTELAKQQLGASGAQVRSDLDQRKQAIEQLVKPLVDGLESLRRDRISAGAEIDKQIRALAEAQDRLRDQTGALVGALRTPNVRGSWGQMQLRRVVEIAGMQPHCDFVEQETIDLPEGGQLRPDMLIKLPGGKQIPVDAKTPDLPLSEATDESGRQAALAASAAALKRHIHELSSKSYGTAAAAAPDFVVLFLPGEYFYSAIYEAEPELIEGAMRERVLIATPMTLLALLYSAAYGWQQEQLAESVREIEMLGQELYKRLALFAEDISDVGKNLDRVVKSYNGAVGSYQARLLPKARDLSEHGVHNGGRQLTTIDPIDRTVRELKGSHALATDAAGLDGDDGGDA